ncbi:hypothetical protein AX17_002905 [Amanita inopinata Kibby_2008]|nr:hypothetical protein AX17_002905 [Amanita inopinata Kibby_2008]
MNPLLALASLRTKLKSNESKIRRRQALGSWLSRKATTLRLLLLLAGYMWMFAIPSPRLGRGIYIDENALQPAQVNTHWSWEEVHNADVYLQRLESLRDVNATSEQRAQFLKAEFTKLGISASTQHYSYSPSSNLVEGTNAYAVLSSPRASGTEAIVISASWLSSMNEGSGGLNLRGVSTILALAAFLKKYSLWAKDVVFVISDGYLDGMHAWLSAYHGATQSNLQAEPLHLSSGIIWTALNVDYPGHSFSHLGIFYEGCNGRLPNQDLQNSVYWIARSNGIPVTVYDHTDAVESNKLPFSLDWLSSPVRQELFTYYQRAKNILRHVGYQARGRPSGVHGLYHQFRIDAITLFAVPATGPHGFYSIGRTIESSLRTMNNLLERLHASFFFFILAAPDRFLKIGSYLPSALLISIAMMFGGLNNWNSAAWMDDKQTTNSHRIGRRRPVLGVLILMAYTHLLGLLLFWTLASSSYMAKPHLVSSAIFTLIIGSLIPATNLFSLSNDVKSSPRSLVLKSLNLCLASSVISVITVLNFSLAMILALSLGIPLSISSYSKPTTPVSMKLIKFTPYAALSFGWLLLVPREVEQAVWYWHMLSIWLMPFVCIIYVPLVLQAGLVCLL